MISTVIDQSLGLEFPIFQGGMAWVADASLAAGVSNAVVSFMTQKMKVEFDDGSDEKSVMKQVLKNCRKVEDECEIYF